MAILKIPNGNGDWEVVEARDPYAIHINESVSDITIGTEDGTTYEQKVNDKTLVITNTEEDGSNNISIGDGDIIPCTSAGLFGSKGYAYAVARAGGIVTNASGDVVPAENVNYSTESNYNETTGEWDGTEYYVHTGQLDTDQNSGFNTFSFANGSALGNYTIAGGRGCFATAGKGFSAENKKFGLTIGYENVADSQDDSLIGTRNYAFGYRGAYALGSSNMFETSDGNVRSNGWLIGYNNKASEDSLVGIGIYNQNLNENTFTFGRRLNTNKEKQMLLGWNANAKDGGSYNTLFAIGDGTETEKSNALLIYKSTSTQQASHAYLYCGLGIGDDSTVTVDKHALAVGAATATHSNSIAVGDNVKTAANNQAVFGTYSNDVPSGLMIVGDGSSSSAHNIFELRNNRTAYFNDCSVGICDSTSSANGYKNSLMVGTFSKASRNNQLKIGEYSTAGTDILFAIGNGTSQGNRSDAFRVTETYSLSNLPMYIGGTAEENKVATKEYVDSAILPFSLETADKIEIRFSRNGSAVQLTTAQSNEINNKLCYVVVNGSYMTCFSGWVYPQFDNNGGVYTFYVMENKPNDPNWVEITADSVTIHSVPVDAIPDVTIYILG